MWCKLLINDNNWRKKKTINGFNIICNSEKVNNVNKLVLKLYLCSTDYSIRLNINPPKRDLFNSVANVPGVFFEKVSEDRWKLAVDNPYIQLI